MNSDKNRVQQHASSPNEIAASRRFESPVWRVVVRAVILGLFMTFWGRLPARSHDDAGYIESGLECQPIEKTVSMLTI